MTSTASLRFTGREWAIVLVLLGAGFMMSVDFSILNVALPEAGGGVGLQGEGLAWITSAFALPAAGFTLLFGRLGDLFGRRRLFLGGMVLLATASLIGGTASSAGVLLTARALQGLATAMALPSALSLLTTTFRDGAKRERVLGLRGALLSAGFAVGALVGGLLVSMLGWRAAFFINVPAALVVLVLAPFVIKESRIVGKPKVDVPGALTVTGGLLAVVYAVIEGSVPIGVVGAVLLVAFGVIEMRTSAPLVPVQILKRPTVTWGNVAGLVVSAMEPAMIFLTTLYLQQVLELSPLMTGIVFGVPGLASVAAGVLAGRIIGRFGGRLVLAVSMGIQGLATLPLVFLGEHRIALVILVPALFVGFFGHVAAIVSYSVVGTSGLPNDEQGLAAGLTSMTQEVGGTIGTPLLIAIAASQTVHLSGLHLALSVDVVLTLASALIVYLALRPKVANRAVVFEGSRSGRNLVEMPR
ncbi:MFS transporter [Kribbella sp. NPDC055071]